MEGVSLIALVSVVGITISGILTNLLLVRFVDNREIIHTKEEIDLDSEENEN